MRPFIGRRLSPVMMYPGASKETGNILKKLGVTKCCVVYDLGIKKAGIVDPIIDAIKAADIDVVVYDKVQPDPPDSSVLEAGALIASEKCDGCVAIGGGSALDTAKAAIHVPLMDPKVLEEEGIQVYDVMKGNPIPGGTRTIKFVTIPTNAGTGAEITACAMVSDSKHDMHKFMLIPKGGEADQAILDPALQLGLPPHITAASGMDAMAHLVEQVIGGSDEWKNIYRFEGIKAVWQWLPVAVRDGKNIEARSRLCFAANVALEQSGSWNGHHVAHAIGSVYHLPHGNCCAYALPPAIRHLAAYSDADIREVAKIIGICSETEDVGDLFATAIEVFYQQLGIKPFCELGLDDKDSFVEKVHTFLKENEPLFYNDISWKPSMTEEAARYYLEQVYYGKKPV